MIMMSCVKKNEYNFSRNVFECLLAEHDQALYHHYSKCHNKSQTDFIRFNPRKPNSGIHNRIKIPRRSFDSKLYMRKKNSIKENSINLI